MPRLEKAATLGPYPRNAAAVKRSSFCSRSSDWLFILRTSPREATWPSSRVLWDALSLTSLIVYDCRIFLQPLQKWFPPILSQGSASQVDIGLTKLKSQCKNLYLYILTMAESVIDITRWLWMFFKLKDKVKNLCCRIFLGPFKTCVKRELK